MYMNINIDIYMYTYQMVFDLLNQPHEMSWRTGMSYKYKNILSYYIYYIYLMVNRPVYESNPSPKLV